jgi:hypothetical protein
MLPIKLRFIWPIDLRGEDFLEINQSETRIACGTVFANGLGRNEQCLSIHYQTWPPQVILVSDWLIS